MKGLYTFFINLFVRFYLQKFPLTKLSEPTKLEGIQNIILFSNTALGDTLMSTPAIIQTKKAFPQAKITLFIAKKIYPLFRDYEYIDNFLLYDKGYKGFISNILKMRSLKPDLILMFHSNGPQDIPTALLSGAKYILKTSRNNEMENLLSTKLTHSPAHFIIKRLETLSFVSLEKYDHIQMKLPCKYHNFVAKKVEGGGQRIGFQMRTSKVTREWGIENFAKLAIMLLDFQDNLEIFLSGTQTEKKYCQKIYAFLPPNYHLRIHNVCGLYPLDELPYFLKSLDCFITGDTGPMHLCGALEIPSIALFLGGAQPKLSGILQDRAIHKEIEQQSPITPHQVFEVWKSLNHSP
ncbi:glycosyltransferase family 9 protein [Helicobacter mesocricetorum]|uniref:glycosyltransferase family 9 protein n=1 Tax=Helicobacter mesocricetorum TaxID=87012 RepID=UPI000CF05099|nr:glycosyltransferase family 9 protein [Helicobacter mesocricetorum]